MKSVRIYQAGQLHADESIELDKPASNHLIRVLRFKNLQLFTMFNGMGGEYTVQLEISGKKAIAHIQSFTETVNESDLKIHLLQGISKGDRMDFAIQKSIELGVHKITPVICERTVVNIKGDRLDKKRAHWQSIAISACEQSGRNYLPEISAPCRFNNAECGNSDALKVMLDPLSCNTMNNIYPGSNNVTIFIGPEGGFTSNEIESAKEAGFNGVTLGPRILRTETAALAAITSAQLLWGDLA